MTQLDSNITYGFVSWHVIKAVADKRTDDDRYPDAEIIPKLTAVIEPTAEVLINMDGVETIVPAKIVVNFDNEGWMIGEDGERGIYLIATDNAAVKPQGFKYRATLTAPEFEPIVTEFSILGGSDNNLTNAVVIGEDHYRMAFVIDHADVSLLPATVRDGDIVLVTDSYIVYKFEA